MQYPNELTIEPSAKRHSYYYSTINVELSYFNSKPIRVSKPNPIPNQCNLPVNVKYN